MFSHITTQADKVRQAVFHPDTAATYQKAGTLTWTIIKETGYLLWLVICIGLVLGEWIWKNSYTAGQSARVWVNNLEKKEDAAPSASMDQVLSDTGKKLLAVGKSGALKAIATAKDQLGIAPEPAAPAAPVAKPPAPAPVSQASASAAPVSTAPPTPAPTIPTSPAAVPSTPTAEE